MSHRRTSIYGPLFFSAVIVAAFYAGHPVEALEIGLTEIPQNCLHDKDTKWALSLGKDQKDY